MIAYADTSFLHASFYGAAPQSPAVMAFLTAEEPDFFWNAFLRAELRHALRRVQDAGWRRTAWQAYTATEAGRARFVPQLLTLRRVMQLAEEASARDNGASGAGTWDLAHVALALEARAPLFLTCDAAQHQAAMALGLKAKFFR